MSEPLLAPSSTVVASREQVSCELAEEVVILNLRNGEYYGLNEVGAKIWTLIQEPRTLDSVREIIMREYPDVEPEQCTADILEIVEQFIDADLATIAAT
jgi:hypothetical protein